MAKRGLSADDAQTSFKKRAKQARLDTFFDASPTKSHLAQSNATLLTEKQQKTGNRTRPTSRPLVIDVDEDDIDPKPRDFPLKSKGKEVQRQLPTTETKPLRFNPLDIDPVSYLPHEQPWLQSGAPYGFLAHCLSTLSQTRSRIGIVNTLTNCLQTIIVKHSGSLLASLYLLSNSLAPAYAPVELGLGPTNISRAIQNISGVTSAVLKRLYNTLGDSGDVAMSAKSNLRTLIPHPPLTVSNVYNSLREIAHSKGPGAAKQKQKVVEKLLISANGEEIRYLTRTLCQNIRVGAVRTSMLTALARAVVLCHASSNVLDRDMELQVPFSLLSQVQSSSLDAKTRTTEPARAELNAIYTNAEALVKRVFVKHPNYDDIVSAILDFGLSELEERVPLSIGVPLHPTLGSPTHSLDEVYERMEGQSFVAEFKYDGQRAQVHATSENGKIVRFKIFSRHLEDMTTKYPDVQALITSALENTSSISSFIMDSEIVAIDPRTGALKSFQELSNRAKKDVELKDVQVSVCLYAFDLMYLNGEVLLQKTFRERRALLRTHFDPNIFDHFGYARFSHVESIESETGRDRIQEFWQRSVESQAEGLMIKLLDNVIVPEGIHKESRRKKSLLATYEPDKRTAAWLKLKKDYVDGIGDSIDLVPIGAWYGNGRKVKWWSPILMGLYDPISGRFVAVCKCMSGFTDRFYKDLRERYTLSDEDGTTCSVRPLWECDFGGFKPDVYFQPQEVWEIRGADITLSPVSVAAKGLISSSRGLSLRFPRYLRRREDKFSEQASTPEFLASIWKEQQGNHQGINDGDELIDADFVSSAVSEEDD